MPSDIDAVVPSSLHLSLERASVVRYGENPHQIGARYRFAGTTPWWDGVTQHAGIALSYLNLFDADAAWRLVHELATTSPGHCAVAIIKHANASGAAVGVTFTDAFQKALARRSPERLRWHRRARRRPRRRARLAHRRGPPGRCHHRLVDHTEAIEILVKRRKATRLLSGPSPEPLGLSVRTFGNTALVQNADELLVPVERVDVCHEGDAE